MGLVVAQFADGSSTQASGFAVRRDGTGGVFLTTKAALVNSIGEQAIAVIVLLPGVAQPLQARIVAVHGTEDVALLRLQQKGGVPVVQGLAWKDPPVGVGGPVALVGYPPPVPLPISGDWKDAVLTPATVTGTATKVTAGFVMIEGWGAVLAPGTPVIAPDGLVVGIDLLRAAIGGRPDLRRGAGGVRAGVAGSVAVRRRGPHSLLCRSNHAFSACRTQPHRLLPVSPDHDSLPLSVTPNPHRLSPSHIVHISCPPSVKRDPHPLSPSPPCGEGGRSA